VLDEPTSGLDASTERGILDALRTLMSSTTTLLATHNMDLVREADEIIVLDHGRIADRGTYPKLTERSPAFQRLVGRRRLTASATDAVAGNGGPPPARSVALAQRAAAWTTASLRRAR
jgi:ATP-binding cassette subfamily B protein